MYNYIEGIYVCITNYIDGTCICIYIYHEQSHIIAHSQGLTNGLSGRDYRVFTISLFYVQK